MDKKFIIEKETIKTNIETIKKTVGDKKIYAVLKGNAYGMGLLPFSQALYEYGIKDFAVTDLCDAVLLKKEYTDCSVLLLTPCYLEKNIETAIDLNITLSVDSLENAVTISKIAAEKDITSTIHIKVDTGMGRYGFLPSQISEIAKVSRLTNLYAEGIFSHLHSAFNKDQKPSIKQFEVFKDVINKLEENSIHFEIQHIANSIATFRFKGMQLNAVRVGSALIGRVNAISGASGLCKVGKLYSEICDIRVLPKGHNIGYAALFKTKNEQKIITTNVGYADGVAVTKADDTFRFIDILRYIFNDLKLILNPTPLICSINGKNAKTLGRIGMTNLVIDANDIDAKIGDLIEVPVNPIYLSSNISREYI